MAVPGTPLSAIGGNFPQVVDGALEINVIGIDGGTNKIKETRLIRGKGLIMPPRGTLEDFTNLWVAFQLE